ncbi:CLUMA_CG014745, isoform A [Clunio marinus]|uniref:CLUMA_CG014745, isoform A n=1 Tax=Clunio marinus TaxID=568069 RepID=A0A1J1IMD7_9DIPT|nr:CLUMA_CG014745, isoform A [Clunio marinus]
MQIAFLMERLRSTITLFKYAKHILASTILTQFHRKTIEAGTKLFCIHSMENHFPNEKVCLSITYAEYFSSHREGELRVEFCVEAGWLQTVKAL